jgi:phosphate/sulfate permease
MRRVVEWVLIAAGVALVVGLIAYGRGPKHHRGDEIGSHGTKVVVVHIVP